MNSDGSKPLMVAGIEVDFPYSQPYDAQKAVIAKSIIAYKTKQNALLESPTGTGKTLSLLASALAYQEYSKKTAVDPPTTLDPNPFEMDFSGQIKEPQNRGIKIYYTSRTHEQLKQVIKELKELKRYNPVTVLLGSRREYCVNPKLKNDPDKFCREVHKKRHECEYGQRSNTIPHVFLPGGEYGKCTIKEMKDFCIENTYCPYLISRNLLKLAELVILPYNYIIDPVVRKQSNIEISNSILIIDEAHNIEDTCRNAGTLTLKETEVNIVTDNFAGYLSHEDNKVLNGAELWDSIQMVSALFEKIQQYFATQVKQKTYGIGSPESKESFQRITDPELMLSGWGLKPQLWPAFSISLYNILKLNEKGESTIFPEILFAILANVNRTLSCIYGGGDNLSDYSAAATFQDDGKQIELLCMTPGIIFKEIAASTHSVVLASGTLSPLDQYASELRVDFRHTLSAAHVIDPGQICSMLVSTLDGVTLSSAARQSEDQKDRGYKAIGELLAGILQTIPDGVLLFFPSGGTMNKCIAVWKRLRIYQLIEAAKPIFVQQSGGTRRGKSPIDDYRTSIARGKGGLLLAVMRGTSSEGVDFVDKMARAVIVFGVPYPNYGAANVKLKMDYNSRHCANPAYEKIPGQAYTCSGDEWFKAQAFRALSQAVGRVIRHRNDYGAIILLDNRFSMEVGKHMFPQWMERTLPRETGFTTVGINDRLARFYGEMRVRFPDTSGPQEISDDAPCDISCADCAQPLFRVQRMTRDAVLSNSQDLHEMLGVPNDSQLTLLPLSATVCSRAKAIESADYTWSYKDQLGYRTLSCPCGKTVGAFVCATMATPAKTPQALNTLLVVENVYVKQGALSIPLTSFVVMPKVMQMKAVEGQMKISFV